MIQQGDSIFMSTAYGLSLYNTRTRQFSRFIDNSPWFDSSFEYGQWLIHRINNKVFVSGGAITFFNVQTKQYEYAAASPQDPLHKLSGVNASYFDESNGLLWLEAGEGILYSYDVMLKTLQQHDFAGYSLGMIDVIKKDNEGNIWLGTHQGLFCYNPSTRKGKKIALNTSEKAVYNLAIGNDSYIWLATANELLRYHRINETKEIILSHALFHKSVFVKRAFLLDPQQRLWVGTNKGFAIIDTKRFKVDNPENKEPQMVNFSVFDKLKNFEKPLPVLDKINLNYDENFFSFSLSAFNYHTPVAYSFKLEGFDKEWQTANSNKGSYTNVPPGSYSLRIKSTNEMGQWIERSVPVIIHIQAPFWQRSWFVFLLAMTGALLIALVYRLYLKQKEKKQINSTVEHFAHSLSGDSSITDICTDIVRNSCTKLKLQDCIVYLMDDEQHVLKAKAAYSSQITIDNDAIKSGELKKGEGVAGKAAETGKPVLIKDLRKWYSTNKKTNGAGSALAVPIVHEAKAIGVIEAYHVKPHFFNNEHIKAFTSIAGISASKMAEAKAEEAAKASEFKLMEIQKLLAETQLMALRAQMNPHFVFNCLNSIQECIVTEKYGEASLYLNKFSKLFRLVLNNSSKIMISLTDEIEVLELYLTLEHMRFEKSFRYTIQKNDELDTDEIMIPSMLLQPFVENALWHGLMHKTSDRLLTISFNKLGEDVFECIIEDNGIGRKKALELKEAQSKTKRHVSKGMSICKDRIELLQKQGQHAGLQIIDKYDETGGSTGTKVIIELSAYLK
jgi:LytS/YehU family sensor histidine kinase